MKGVWREGVLCERCVEGGGFSVKGVWREGVLCERCVEGGGSL